MLWNFYLRSSRLEETEKRHKEKPLSLQSEFITATATLICFNTGCEILRVAEYVWFSLMKTVKWAWRSTVFPSFHLNAKLPLKLVITSVRYSMNYLYFIIISEHKTSIFLYELCLPVHLRGNYIILAKWLDGLCYNTHTTIVTAKILI